MWLEIVYSGEEMAVVVDYAPEENSDILGRRLTAINGTDVFDIAEMLRPYVSYETDNWFYSKVFSRRMILYSEVLRYIGIIGDGNSAVFTFTDAAGNASEVTLSAVPVAKLWDGVVRYNVNESVYCTYTGYGVLSYNNSDDIWYAPMYDGSALYIRFNTCYVDESIGEIVENAFADAREANCLEKVIVDFRFNSGGWLDLQGNFLPLANALSESGAEVYVLIDGGSFSAAVGIPAVLKRRIEKLTIIGSPAGQAVSFFFNGTFELPNSGLYCQYSKQRADFWPGNEDETLMPDVTVYQSYIDYRLGVDSVLMYIFGK